LKLSNSLIIIDEIAALQLTPARVLKLFQLVLLHFYRISEVATHTRKGIETSPAIFPRDHSLGCNSHPQGY